MSENFEKLIGKQIAKLRKERNLTQAELAEAVNVAPETISRLERGISIPSLRALENIGGALKVQLKELFDFENTQKRKATPAEKELTRVVALLTSKKTVEIRLGYSILKSVFEATKKLRQI